MQNPRHQDLRIVHLPKNSNQTLGLIELAKRAMKGEFGEPPAGVLKRIQELFTDEIVSHMAALTTPEIIALRKIQMRHQIRKKILEGGVPSACMLGSQARLHPEHAVLANVAGDRFVDMNPTIFGLISLLKKKAGEFAHLEWMQAILTACQIAGLNGKQTMIIMAWYTQARVKFKSATKGLF